MKLKNRLSAMGLVLILILGTLSACGEQGAVSPTPTAETPTGAVEQTPAPATEDPLRLFPKTVVDYAEQVLADLLDEYVEINGKGDRTELINIKERETGAAGAEYTTFVYNLTYNIHWENTFVYRSHYMVLGHHAVTDEYALLGEFSDDELVEVYGTEEMQEKYGGDLFAAAAAELYREWQIRNLASAVDPNIWKQVEDYAVEAFLEARPLGESEWMELRYVEAFHTPIYGENSAVCIYLAYYSHEREQILGLWEDSRPTMKLIGLWEDLDTDLPRFIPLGYRSSFGNEMDLDNSVIYAQVEEMLGSYEGEIPSQTIDRFCESIVFSGSEPVAAARTFISEYAASLVTAEPGNFYSVTDCTVLDWVIEELSTDHNRMKIRFKLGLLPAGNLNNFIISGTKVGEGEESGWYTMEQEVVLERREDGLWYCPVIGNDLPHVGMSFVYSMEGRDISTGMNAAAHDNDATGYALLDPYKIGDVTGYSALVYETGTGKEKTYNFYEFVRLDDSSVEVGVLSVPAAYSALYCGESNELIVAGEHEGEKWAYRVYIDHYDLRYEAIEYPEKLPEKVEFVPISGNHSV